MTRANLLIVTVLTVGLAGMFFWTLSIHNEQSRIAGEGTALGPAGSDSDHERRLRDLEDTAEELRLRVESNRGTLARAEEQLERVESSLALQRQEMAALSGGGGAAVASGGGGETVLVEAIEDVLEKKEEQERRERMERMARGMSRFLLAEIEATDEQRDRFVQVITSYMTKRGEIRERFSGEDADEHLRDQEIERLDGTRDSELQQIFGAGDLATIQERLERGARWMGGRRGGPRGADSGGRSRTGNRPR